MSSEPRILGGEHILLELFELHQLTFMANHSGFPSVHVEGEPDDALPDDPESRGHIYRCWVDDENEPTWGTLDERLETPVHLQLVAELQRISAIYMEAAIGIAWQCDEMLNERDAASESSEFVGIGVYDPRKPRSWPRTLRGPFPLTEEAMRFLLAAVRSYNDKVACTSAGFARVGIFPWCPQDDESATKTTTDTTTTEPTAGPWELLET